MENGPTPEPVNIDAAKEMINANPTVTAPVPEAEPAAQLPPVEPAGEGKEYTPGPPNCPN